MTKQDKQFIVIITIIGVILLLWYISPIFKSLTRGGDFPRLHRAAQRGDIESVKVQLRKGVNVNTRDHLISSTPLHWATIYGHQDIATILLSKGADVNARDKYLFTPLHYAADEELLSMMQILLDYGADVNAKGGDGDTPLHCVIRENDSSCLRRTSSFYTWKKRSDIQSTTTMESPVSHKQLAVELLLSKGAHPEAVDHKGKTPLHLAAWNGEIPLVTLLLATGVNINAIDVENRTPLFYAIGSGDTSLVELFLVKKADVNVQPKDHSKTLLQYAKRLGRDDIVELLRKYGAKE